jgi:hypothetical protein
MPGMNCYKKSETAFPTGFLSHPAISPYMCSHHWMPSSIKSLPDISRSWCCNLSFLQWTSLRCCIIAIENRLNRKVAQYGREQVPGAAVYLSLLQVTIFVSTHGLFLIFTHALHISHPQNLGSRARVCVLPLCPHGHIQIQPEYREPSPRIMTLVLALGSVYHNPSWPYYFCPHQCPQCRIHPAMPGAGHTTQKPLQHVKPGEYNMYFSTFKWRKYQGIQVLELLPQY